MDVALSQVLADRLAYARRAARYQHDLGRRAIFAHCVRLADGGRDEALSGLDIANGLHGWADGDC
jgi:hypothetical protein